MNKDLYDLADKVETEQDFLSFLEALMLDRVDEKKKEKIKPNTDWGPGENGWENGSIETFLDAAFAWGESSTGDLEFYKKPDNPWKRVAHILHAGKFYE